MEVTIFFEYHINSCNLLLQLWWYKAIKEARFVAKGRILWVSSLFQRCEKRFGYPKAFLIFPATSFGLTKHATSPCSFSSHCHPSCKSIRCETRTWARLGCSSRRGCSSLKALLWNWTGFIERLCPWSNLQRRDLKSLIYLVCLRDIEYVPCWQPPSNCTENSFAVVGEPLVPTKMNEREPV